MANAVCRKAATVSFWDGYAPWYKLWMEHARYHERILEVLFARVEPGWKILDVGCGNGVLSLPLSGMGCDVTALEPSIGMRSLFFAEAFSRDIDRVAIDERRWEDVWHDDFPDHDLIVACNSLHLTSLGFDAALEKVFRANPRRIFVVTETAPGIDLPVSREGYRTVVEEDYEIESSFAYHAWDEAFAHAAFKRGRPLTLVEEFELQDRLTERDGHLWMKDTGTVAMRWWERRGSDVRFPSDFQGRVRHV